MENPRLLRIRLWRLRGSAE